MPEITATQARLAIPPARPMLHPGIPPVAVAERPQPPPTSSPLAPWPRLIHQVWVGPSSLPAKWQDFGDGWRAMHPDWGYRLWADADVPALVNDCRAALGPDCPDLAGLIGMDINLGYVSDILRLMVVYLYGGVYLDTDCEALRPLDGLTANCDAFIGATCDGNRFPGVQVENAVLGGRPRHPFWGLALRELPRGLAESYEPDKNWTTIYATGPGYLSRRLLEWRATPASLASDVAILPNRFLYPLHYDSPTSGPEYDAAWGSAYSHHHFGQSWVKTGLPDVNSLSTGYEAAGYGGKS